MLMENTYAVNLMFPKLHSDLKILVTVEEF